MAADTNALRCAPPGDRVTYLRMLPHAGGFRFCANVRVVDSQCRAMKTTLVPIVTCLFLEEGSIRSPFDGRVVAC